MTDSPRVRLVCTGRRTHEDTILATCTLHDDWLETTRIRTRHSDEWGKTTIDCHRCSREWQLKEARLEELVTKAIELGVSRIDLSRIV